MEQKILVSDENYAELDVYFEENGVRSVLLVCGKSISFLRIEQYFETLEERKGIKVIRFMDFQPNPIYESVVQGVEIFCENACDLIVAVGGGSAIDVAKCIKLYSNMNPKINYLEQTIVPNEVKLLAVPTTAGSGSEATRYAVIYYKGEKQSVVHESGIPCVVLMDAKALETLPVYQKKATMMDAFCHAIESFWSVNSTQESKEYAREAIRLIIENKDFYLQNDKNGNTKMLWAANLAGKAINITQTTAGHAMCYKLTGLYGISHGHAAALCTAVLWRYMLEYMEQCVDYRGIDYLQDVFMEIAKSMSCNTVEAAIEYFHKFILELGLEAPVIKNRGEMDILKLSVNPVRLKNNPVKLEEKDIEELYLRILDADTWRK